MLGIYEYETFRDPAFIDALLDIRGDIDEGPSGGDVEPQFFAVAFHF